MKRLDTVNGPTPCRIGLVREHPSLPDLERQSEILTTVGECPTVVEVGVGAGGGKRLEKMLSTLPKGPTVCLVSLDVFGKALPDLVRLLRDLGELSISVAIITRKDGETLLRPHEETVELLRRLSAYNGRSQPQPGDGPQWYGRTSRAASEFNRHQVLHAKKLYGEGMSLRAIGLIFQTSPEEVWKVVS
ncbi:MAG: hypothetical protein K9G59_08455 [Caulobacter sp.]|nr:hypothetical protein [Caulobacter sp.]